MPYSLIYNEKIPQPAQKAIANVFENFDFFCRNNKVDFNGTVKIGIDKINTDSDVYVSQKFIELLSEKVWHHEEWFESLPLLVYNDFDDYIGTCFYMINCVQEYADEVEDQWNRFDYKKSYQYGFDCAQENFVIEYFKLIAEQLGMNNNFDAPATIFLSHDIDKLDVKRQSISTEWRTFNLSAIFRNMAKGKNDFLEDLINIERNNSVKATYFWLTEQNDFEGIPHADYDLNEVRGFIDFLNNHPNFENGLHKSAHQNSLNEEANKIGDGIKLNRYHFLKYNVKEDYEKLEASEMEADCSMGFSHAIGFRNSYGLPFKPFSPIAEKQFNFWVHPLHIMDSTLIYYTKGTLSQKEKLIREFFAKHTENCQIGVLWHNNYLFGEHLSMFERVLENSNEFVKIS